MYPLHVIITLVDTRTKSVGSGDKSGDKSVH